MHALKRKCPSPGMKVKEVTQATVAERYTPITQSLDGDRAHSSGEHLCFVVSLGATLADC